MNLKVLVKTLIPTLDEVCEFFFTAVQVFIFVGCVTVCMVAATALIMVITNGITNGISWLLTHFNVSVYTQQTMIFESILLIPLGCILYVVYRLLRDRYQRIKNETNNSK